MSVRVGVDVVKVSRIREAADKRGDAFIRKIFTPSEIEYCEARPSRKFEHYAGRFAAKEAFYKAASPASQSIRFNEIEVTRGENGAPGISLNPEGVRQYGIGSLDEISVSLSHDTDYAFAVVTIDRP